MMLIRDGAILTNNDPKNLKEKTIDDIMMVE